MWYTSCCRIFVLLQILFFLDSYGIPSHSYLRGHLLCTLLLYPNNGRFAIGVDRLPSYEYVLYIQTFGYTQTMMAHVTHTIRELNTSNTYTKLSKFLKRRQCNIISQYNMLGKRQTLIAACEDLNKRRITSGHAKIAPFVCKLCGVMSIRPQLRGPQHRGCLLMFHCTNDRYNTSATNLPC